MLLPGGAETVVDILKLRDYVLNPLHLRGRHKARVFASALRICQEDAEYLRERLLEAAATKSAVAVDRDEYGERYILDFECARGDRSAMVRSGWIVLSGESFPRLTTCFVLSD